MFNGRMLLLKRKNGIWEFPGGGVDWGENPDQAAKRELKEETGLEVKGMRLLGITSAVFDKGGVRKHAIYIVYSGESTHGKHAISSEHAEARWLLPNEARYMKLGLNAEPILELL
jgi:ADP-ribose pyrophosphatase YjhB (NUDIX family)